jgi:hypothetical protein
VYLNDESKIDFKARPLLSARPEKADCPPSRASLRKRIRQFLIIFIILHRSAHCCPCIFSPDARGLQTMLRL